MASDARLQIVLRLKDEASKRMKNIDNSFKRSGANIGKSAATGAMVAGGAFTATGATMLKFGDQSKEAENILKMGTGAMGEDLEALKEATRSVSGQVPQDFGTVATAIQAVATEFGLTGKPLEEMTKMFLDVARVSGSEVDPMIKGVNDTMQIFGDDQTETNRILGDFIKISQETGIPLGKLITDMNTYGPVLKNAGFETSEAAAMIGTLNKTGIDAGRVFPGLNKRMRDLADEGITDMKTALMDDITFIQNAATETDKLNAATEVFGSEGAQRMLAAIEAGLIPSLASLDKAVADSEDEVQNLTKDSMTTSEQFQVLKNKIGAVIDPFSEYIALIGAILVPIGLLALAFGGLALAATALSIPLLPLIAVIMGIVAAVTLGVIIFKNWENILGFFRATWDKIWDKIDEPVMAIWGVIKTFINFFIDAINQVIKGFNKIKVPKWVPGLGGKGVNIPLIPSLAKGGIVTSPTIAQIGEAGPEAVIPLNGKNGVGTTVVVNFPPSSTVFLDNEASARALGDQITQQIRGVLRAQGSF